MSMEEDVMAYIAYIRGTIEEDATPEEYQELLDFAIPAEVRGRKAYEGFRESVYALRQLEANNGY